MIATAPDTAVGALRAAVDGLLALDWPAIAPAEVAGLICELEASRRRLAAVDVQMVASFAAQARPASCAPDLLNGPVTGRFLSDPVGRMGS